MQKVHAKDNYPKKCWNPEFDEALGKRAEVRGVFLRKKH
jgi:hypothetical protein